MDVLEANEERTLAHKYSLFLGLAVWILEHRINSAFRGPPSHHLGMIFYFPFSTLVFAHRERIVSNLARLVVVVWMFVVLILNSTYTASLSSRLTVQRLRPAIADVKELIRKGHSVGCYQGSFVCDILRGVGFEDSKIKTYRLPEDYEEALSNGSKSGNISAFFDVVPYSKLFLAKYCDKYTIVSLPIALMVLPLFSQREVLWWLMSLEQLSS